MSAAPFKADVRAADRLLRAAVREATRLIRAGDDFEVLALDGGGHTFHLYDRDAVVQMLAEATRSASLLLKERDA